MSSDRRRQVLVTVAEILCLLGTMLGVGVFGGDRVQEAAGGALAADATLLAPAVPAFSIWTPIYLGLAAYTVLQWLPGWTRSERHRSIGALVAASMLLNAAWLVVVWLGWLWVSVAVIAVLVATLVLLNIRLKAHPATTWTERLVVDVTFGLYLGWVCVATCANVTATLVAAGGERTGQVSELLAVMVVVVALAVALLATWRLGAPVGLTIAMAWGLSWIGWARLTGAPHAPVVGWAAVVAAVLVVAAYVVARGTGIRRTVTAPAP